MPVESFITPPLCCFKCQGFGHTASRCQRKETCARCAGEHNSRHCQLQNVCFANCRGSHTSRSTRCSVYLWASKVQECKNARGCSWARAMELCGDCPEALAAPITTVTEKSDIKQFSTPFTGPRFTFKVNEKTQVRTLQHTMNNETKDIAHIKLVSPEVKAHKDSEPKVKNELVVVNNITPTVSPIKNNLASTKIDKTSESSFPKVSSTPSSDSSLSFSRGDGSSTSTSDSKATREETSLTDVT